MYIADPKQTEIFCQIEKMLKNVFYMQSEVNVSER